jgi:hypothetical protein
MGNAKVGMDERLTKVDDMPGYRVGRYELAVDQDTFLVIMVVLRHNRTASFIIIYQT